jgi:tetratricopeptide (TPR) repeat protein
LQKVQDEATAHPTNFQNIVMLGSLYTQLQDTNRVVALFKQAESLFDPVLANPNADPNEVTAMAQIAARVGDISELEKILEKLVAVLPDRPEAYYDLAVIKTVLGKNDEALKNLKSALDLSAKRLSTNSSARNLLTEARADQRFNPLRNLPEFQKLVPPD